MRTKRTMMLAGLTAAVLSKIGVTSRTAAAREAARLGIGSAN